MQEIRNLEVKDEYVHDDPFEHTKVIPMIVQYFVLDSNDYS